MLPAIQPRKRCLGANRSRPAITASPMQYPSVRAPNSILTLSDALVTRYKCVLIGQPNNSHDANGTRTTMNSVVLVIGSASLEEIPICVSSESLETWRTPIRDQQNPPFDHRAAM